MYVHKSSYRLRFSSMGRNDESSTLFFNISFSIIGPLRRPWGQNSARSRSLARLPDHVQRLEFSNYEFEPSKSNVLSSLRPTDENPRRHEQVYRSNVLILFSAE